MSSLTPTLSHCAIVSHLGYGLHAVHSGGGIFAAREGGALSLLRLGISRNREVRQRILVLLSWINTAAPVNGFIGGMMDVHPLSWDTFVHACIDCEIVDRTC